MNKVRQLINIEPLIEELVAVNGFRWAMPKDDPSKREMLKTLMTLSKPANLSDAYYTLEKQYLAELNIDKTIVQVESIDEVLVDQLYIFRGDITGIQADAIVNAANEKLLGCFVPGHHCIDNAIQMSSGLGVRNACNAIIEAQGHDEPVGLAKITSAYNLPSKYIVHTVGPNINGPYKLTWEQVTEQLRSCYLSILKGVAAYEDIKSLVFCSISTGIYGVPIDLASEIALTTINAYLKNECHHLEHVVIDVFSEEDYNAYRNNAKKIKSSL